MDTTGLPLRAGASGEAVRDVQRRLRDAGYGVPADEDGHFGDGSVAALRAFQEARGLRIDGICGPQTWGALVEAGYALGDRLLYHRSPMLRGDDVATLQRRLSALGFDTGRVDGILGPNTARAISEFQRNSGITVDGTCGPETLRALSRLGARTDDGDVVAGVREREAMRLRPTTLSGRRVVVGETGGLSVLAQTVARALARAGAEMVVLHDPDESVQAREANEAGADLFIGVSVDPTRDGCCTSYYAHPVTGTFSLAGRQLAERIQETLPSAVGIADRGVRGLRIAVLRETRMPAVVIELGPPTVAVQQGSEVAEAVAVAASAWTSAPCP